MNKRWGVWNANKTSKRKRHSHVQRAHTQAYNKPPNESSSTVRDTQPSSKLAYTGALTSTGVLYLTPSAHRYSTLSQSEDRHHNLLKTKSFPHSPPLQRSHSGLTQVLQSWWGTIPLYSGKADTDLEWQGRLAALVPTCSPPSETDMELPTHTKGGRGMGFLQ